MKSKTLGKLLIPLLLIPVFLLVTFFVYRESFRGYFFQDDWYSISISKKQGIGDVLKFFIPDDKVVYYRPLGMQLPFYLSYSLFGLNPLPLKILSLLINSLNAWLVFLILRKMLKAPSFPLLAALMYAVSGVHYIPFYWSATIAFVLGPFFSLLSVYMFIREKEFYALIFFVVGLLTFETAVVLPVLFLLYGIIFHRKKLSGNLIIFIFISVVYSLYRIVLKPPPDIPEYQMALNREVLLNLKYYLLWAFNWPEEMKNQFISFFRVNPEFVRDFKNYYYSFIVTLVINLILLFVWPWALLLMKRKGLDLKIMAFAFVWCLLSLLPVIFFPVHTFPYYLPLFLIGLFLFVGSYYGNVYKGPGTGNSRGTFVIPALILVNWLAGVFTLVDFNAKVHWAPRRSAISRELTAKAMAIRDLSEPLIFVVKPDPENRFALNDQDALRITFDDPGVVTLYTLENSDGIKL